ncbi:hypothetical protein RRF57_007418 [Xylaria bambusicola]|uniref:Uncharacterized protein n=1 Tax=Xylaria bambusicola TaxID=326684 RepID=A0AAN7UQH4_9PEZI
MANSSDATAFSRPQIDLRHGDYQGSPRLLAHRITRRWMREDLASREKNSSAPQKIHTAEGSRIGDDFVRIVNVFGVA